jgi:hypothetical protein
MSEQSASKSEKAIAVAFIGAAATIIVALIGVVPPLFRDKGSAEAAAGARPAPRSGGPRTVFLFGKPAPPRHERPPLRVSHRRSKIPGQGMVLGLGNTTEKETLRQVFVAVQSAGEEGERSYRVARSIRPNDTLAVGWKELRGWKLRPGDRVKVKVEGYTLPLKTTIPRD